MTLQSYIQNFRKKNILHHLIPKLLIIILNQAKIVKFKLIKYLDMIMIWSRYLHIVLFKYVLNLSGDYIIKYYTTLEFSFFLSHFMDGDPTGQWQPLL